jgi:hypothetical protein
VLWTHTHEAVDIVHVLGYVKAANERIPAAWLNQANLHQRHDRRNSAVKVKAAAAVLPS